MVNIRQILFYILTIFGIAGLHQIRGLMAISEFEERIMQLKDSEPFQWIPDWEMYLSDVIIEDLQRTIDSIHNIDFSGHIFFIVNFVLLWILAKNVHKSALLTSITTSAIMVFLSFLILHRWFNGDIIRFLVHNLHFYLSILVINYAVISRFSVLKSSLFLFAALFLIYFPPVTVSSWRSFIEFLPTEAYAILTVVTIIYYRVGIYLERRKLNLEEKITRVE